MGRHQPLRSLNLQAFADRGVPLNEQILLHNLERLAPEFIGLESDLIVILQVRAELRPSATGLQDTWLHLIASTSIPLTCQRCMAPVQTALQVDQWYRFVDSEEVAMADDDASIEDLLVMTPQFDLLSLLEDELLMALPLVPMHDHCPVAPVFSAGLADLLTDTVDKPNPFAALAQLKKSGN